MKILLNGTEINDFCVKSGDFPQAATAEKYFRGYVERLTGKKVSGNAGEVRFICDGASDDGFTVSLDKNALTFSGGKRGVIYAVFEFLKKCGCRFFTPTLETYPTADVSFTDFTDSQLSPFLFRDVLSIYTSDREWSLKNRLNSCLWNQRRFTEAEGGGWKFAGIPAHTLTGEFLLAPYTETHPEYFSLVDGKRMTDRMGQVCMTSDEAVDVVAEEVKKLLENNPDCNIVSVSMGDNKNFCTCEKCREKTARVGLARAYYDFINAVAYKIYEYRPDVLVHTFAYMNLCDIGDEFALAPNIMIQYCTAGCAIHPIGGCEHNADQAKNLAVWSKMCKNVFIWDYINCFKYELMDMPTVYNYPANLRTFARNGVKGVFNEGAHDTAYDKNCGFVGMPELRGYLMSAAMWNPFMSDEEYQIHIDEFCAAFYGEGGKAAAEYVKLLYDYSRDSHATYDCNDFGTPCAVTNYIDKDKTAEFLSRAYALVKPAAEAAKGEFVPRLEKLLIEITYYDLFHNMERTLESGTDEEKRAAYEKNEWLVRKLRENDVRLTFWGKTGADQQKNLDPTVPPSKWDYSW